MSKQNLKTGDMVYITTTNAIGFIIDQGNDGIPWYRTDADGICESHELKLIKTSREILFLIMKNNANIAPSTKKEVNKHLGFELFSVEPLIIPS